MKDGRRGAGEGSLLGDSAGVYCLWFCLIIIYNIIIRSCCTSSLINSFIAMFKGIF